MQHKKWMQHKKQEGNHGHQIVVHILHPNVKQRLLATAATNVTRRRLQLQLLQLYLLYLELHHSSRGKHMSPANKKFQLSLRLFGAVIVLSCPSSADAECAISALNSIATALRHLMSWDSIRMHLIGKQDTPAADEYPVACAASAWAPAVTGDRRRFRGSKRKVRSDKGKKRNVRAFVSCDDNALEEMFRPGAPPDADSSSSSSQSSNSSSDSSSSEDEAEMARILGKCVKKNV